MMLLTKENKNALPLLGAQDEKGDAAVVHVKFFDPGGSFTWYATEFCPDEGRFFGYVTSSLCPQGEWGYFMLDELTRARGQYGQTMERDRYFKAGPLNDVLPNPHL